MATDAELVAVEAEVVADAESGLDSVTVDGMNVNVMDPLKRLDVIERVERRNTSDPFATMRHTRLRSQGGMS